MVLEFFFVGDELLKEIVYEVEDLVKIVVDLDLVIMVMVFFIMYCVFVNVG